MICTSVHCGECRFLSFRAKWGRSKFCKMQIGDGAMPCVCRLQRPAHGPKFARISECRLLSPSVTSCHLPRQMEAFFGGSKPTALHLSYILLRKVILPYGSYICLRQVILLTLFAVVDILSTATHQR